MHDFKNLLFIILFVAFFGIFLMTFQGVIILVLLVFFVGTIDFYQSSKYQILHIKKSGDSLIIDYLEGDKHIHVEDRLTKFSFSKERVWYKVRLPVYFLEVKFEGKTILKQFLRSDINEKTVDSIVSNFK